MLISRLIYVKTNCCNKNSTFSLHFMGEIWSILWFYFFILIYTHWKVFGGCSGNNSNLFWRFNHSFCAPKCWLSWRLLFDSFYWILGFIMDERPIPLFISIVAIVMGLIYCKITDTNHVCAGEVWMFEWWSPNEQVVCCVSRGCMVPCIWTEDFP